GKREKGGGHDGADRVAADILRPSIAAAVAKEAAHRAYRAEFELFPEHVAGQVRPAPSVAAIVPQHVRLRMSWCRPATRLLAYITILGVVRDESLSAARARVSPLRPCSAFSATPRMKFGRARIGWLDRGLSACALDSAIAGS